MPLVAGAFCSVAEFKSYRGITSSSYDTLIEFLINSSTAWIIKYLGGRKIYNDNTSITEYFDGREFANRRSIFLPNFPVTEVSGVAYSQEDNYGNPTWVDYSNVYDYIVNKKTGEIRFSFSLPYSAQSIRIIYKGGFTTIPDDIKLACCMLVAKVFDKRKSQGVSSEGIGGANLGWETGEYYAPFGLNAEIKGLLDHYRLFTF